jgi:hypothetical protein
LEALKHLDFTENTDIREIKRQRISEFLRLHPDKIKFSDSDTDDYKDKVRKEYHEKFVKKFYAFEIVINFREKGAKSASRMKLF